MNSYSLNKIENNQKYEKIVSDSLIEYEKYFCFELIDKPCLIFLNSRQQFNDICGHETQGWVTGYTLINVIFLLDESVYETESTRKFNQDIYNCQIKHEVCHCFFRQLAWKKRPVWVNEGVSIYLSGQLKFHKPIETFKNFLDFYENEQVTINNSTVYDEAGFVVEKLVNKFGKEKLLTLIKSLRNISNQEQFNLEFKQIYNFDLNYDNINKL